MLSFEKSISRDKDCSRRLRERFLFSKKNSLLARVRVISRYVSSSASRTGLVTIYALLCDVLRGGPSSWNMIESIVPLAAFCRRSRVYTITTMIVGGRFLQMNSYYCGGDTPSREKTVSFHARLCRLKTYAHKTKDTCVGVVMRKRLKVPSKRIPLAAVSNYFDVVIIFNVSRKLNRC